MLQTSRHLRNLFLGMSQCPDSPPVVLYVSAKNGLPAEEVTWPKMLKTYGYRTAAVGKNIIPVNIFFYLTHYLTTLCKYLKYIGYIT